MGHFHMKYALVSCSLEHSLHEGFTKKVCLLAKYVCQMEVYTLIVTFYCHVLLLFFSYRLFILCTCICLTFVVTLFVFVHVLNNKVA